MTVCLSEFEIRGKKEKECVFVRKGWGWGRGVCEYVYEEYVFVRYGCWECVCVQEYVGMRDRYVKVVCVYMCERERRKKAIVGTESERKCPLYTLLFFK